MVKTASVETFKEVLSQVVIRTIGGSELDLDKNRIIREQACNVRMMMTLRVIRIEKTRMLVIYCLYAASIETGISIDIVDVMNQLHIPLSSKSTCITRFAGKGHILNPITTECAIMEKIKCIVPQLFPDDPELHLTMLESTVEELSEACEEVSSSDSRIIAASIIIVYCKRLEIELDQPNLCDLLNVKPQGVKKKSRKLQEIYDTLV